MKHLIKNNQIVMSGLPEVFTRENGESFWGGYENRTDLHYEDGWRDEVIPAYDPLLEGLGELFYSVRSDVVTYEIYPRTDIPSIDQLKNEKIKEIKLCARNILVETDFYIIRRAETGKSVPQEILNARQAVRVWSDNQEKAVTAMLSQEDVLTFGTKY